MSQSCGNYNLDITGKSVNKMECERCQPNIIEEAVAVIPMPSPLPPIPVCESHKVKATEAGFYLESFAGVPVWLDRFNKRIIEKHLELRGTHDLKIF